MARAKTAEQYLAEFEEEVPYLGPPVGLVAASRPDPAAVATLERHLAVATEGVREKIVRLLVDLGISTDPSAPMACEAIRNPEVIGALANTGLRYPGAAREEAITALRRYCVQPDLVVHGEVITRALQLNPTWEAFLLVAKAKPLEATTVVSDLSESGEWSTEEEAKVARAALGIGVDEDDFLRCLDTANDGKSLAQALRLLSLVGTKRCLEAVAGYLRTPVTIVVPHAFEKSVRLDVLDALVYHFPYEPVLNSNRILDDSSYEAAEEFCTRTFGVTYTTPRPPFLTYDGYPRF